MYSPAAELLFLQAYIMIAMKLLVKLMENVLDCIRILRYHCYKVASKIVVNYIIEDFTCFCGISNSDGLPPINVLCWSMLATNHKAGSIKNLGRNIPTLQYVIVS